MDHPKPRNHPKGKSGPKKRVATDASLNLPETADVKKVKVMDSEDSTIDPVIDPTRVPTVDSVTDPFPAPDVPGLCQANPGDDESSHPGSPSVKYEFVEPEFDTEFDTDTESEPSVEPSTDAEAELELESEFEPELESELESGLISEGEEIKTRKLCSIKSEPKIFEE